MNRIVLPGGTIGVLGSGQLGRMMALAARRMGYRVHTLSPATDTPTGQVADLEIAADYDDLDAIGTAPQILVDFSGNETVVNGVKQRAGESFLRTIVIGSTHWQDRERDLIDLAPGSELFFLPAWIEKRRADWGPAEFFTRSDKAWDEFLPTTESWMQLAERRGAEDLVSVYSTVLAGDYRPETGFVLQFS